MNQNHPTESSSTITLESGRTHKRPLLENGEVKGSKPPSPRPHVPEPVPPYAVDRQGRVLPPGAYDRTKGHAYVGPLHPCRRCLIQLIPQPEDYCSLCAKGPGHHVEAVA